MVLRLLEVAHLLRVVPPLKEIQLSHRTRALLHQLLRRLLFTRPLSSGLSEIECPKKKGGGSRTRDGLGDQSGCAMLRAKLSADFTIPMADFSISALMTVVLSLAPELPKNNWKSLANSSTIIFKLDLIHHLTSDYTRLHRIQSTTQTTRFFKTHG